MAIVKTTSQVFYGSAAGTSMKSVSVRSGGTGNISSIDFPIFKQSFISNGGKYSLNGKDLSFIDIYILVRGKNYPIRITAHYSDGGTEIITAYESSSTITANWGISLSGTLSTGTDYIDITLGEESQAKRITKLYGMTGEVSNVSGTVDAGTVFTGLDGSAFANNIMSLANPTLTSAPTKVAFSYDQTSDTCSLDVITSTGTSNIFNGQPTTILYIRGNKLGLTGLPAWVQSYIEGDPKTSVEDSITLTATFTGITTSVRKFYGSVNGQAKLICQNFGHLSYT